MNQNLVIEMWPVDKLIPYARNTKEHPPEQIAQIAASIQEFSFNDPIAVDERGVIIEGHGRLLAARKLGMSEVPVIQLTHMTDSQRRAYIIAHNKISQNSGFDIDLLKIELQDIQIGGLDIGLTGFSVAEIDSLFSSVPSLIDDADVLAGPEVSKAKMADSFSIPPFSVIDTRQEDWQARKNEWAGLGVVPSVEPEVDPVLTEVLCRWFCPPSGQIMDFCSNGPMHGIVAGFLGYDYVGVAQKHKQIAANESQCDVIFGTPSHLSSTRKRPLWVNGEIPKAKKIMPKGFSADFILSRLSSRADLAIDSEAVEFIPSYWEVICRYCEMLKPDSFAAFVISGMEYEGGGHWKFVLETIQAFADAGLTLYNDAILYGSCKTVPEQAKKQFDLSRKISVTHQNVLIFVKGDPIKAAQRCGLIEVLPYDYSDAQVEFADS